MARILESIRALALVTKVAMRANSRLTLRSVVSQVSSMIAYPLFGLALKLLIDAIATQDANAVMMASLWLAGTVCLLWLVRGVAVRSRFELQDHVNFEFEKDLMRMTSEIPGLEHFERPDYVRQLELLRRERSTLSQAVNFLIINMGELALVCGAVGLLLSVHSLLVLTIPLGIPMFVTTLAASKRTRMAEEGSADSWRLARHAFSLGTSASSGKEIRVFELQEEITRLYESARFDANKAMARAHWTGALLVAAARAFFGLGSAAILALLLVGGFLASSSPGDILLAIFVAALLNSRIAAHSAAYAARFQRLLIDSTRFLWLVDFHKSALRVGSGLVPSHARQGFELTNVSFKYPGTDDYALRDVNLLLAPGTTVALVGDNGAGKTTLVKLLCGFYEPTDGSITLDGQEVSMLDPVELRSVISAAFQDFFNFELLARQAVGVGNLPLIDDARAVENALIRARAHDLIDELPAGLDTELGKTWGGVDLSVGQWQRLALGRSLMRSRPLLLALDEPTANLDAHAEFALFERISALLERAGEQTIRVIVSHRFSTVKMADFIVVIERGKIVEVGSHDLLMAGHGLYSELYKLHQEGYR